MGGGWGARLKLAGFDGIIVYGKSDKPVYLLVQEGRAELKDASGLWGKDAATAQRLLKDELGNTAKVLAIGQAGENMVTFATTLSAEDACAWGAAIMGSKNLKAIVTSGKGKRPPVAQPEKFKEISKYIRESWQGVGLDAKLAHIPRVSIKKQICHGCVSGCVRSALETTDGVKVKVCCQAAGFYRPAADAYYGKATDIPLLAARLCYDYGLDTHTMAALLRWLRDGYKAGILTEANTELPLSQYGSWDFIDILIKKISHREGFGDVMAQGLHHTADAIGEKGRELITDYLDKNGQKMAYGPRLYNISGIFYATEPRMSLPILHEMTIPLGNWKQYVKGMKGAYMSYDFLREMGKRFWGSELAFDCSTYEGKAIAAKKIQDKIHTQECLILCAFFYPLRSCDSTQDHKGDPAIESRLYSAVTGNEKDEDELNKAGERVFNLQRAILAREDPRGRKVDEIPESDFTVPYQGEANNPDALVPGKGGEPIIKKGNTVDREKFNKMLSEYYELRGWNDNGLQTKQKLIELDLGDIAEDLSKRGLLA